MFVTSTFYLLLITLRLLFQSSGDQFNLVFCCIEGNSTTKLHDDYENYKDPYESTSICETIRILNVA